MCGICGIYNFNSKEKIKESDLRKMAKVIKHRGPDDEGFYTHKNIGLAHRRLSVIDLSQFARQPMTNEDNTIWITYNGEIYNYLELREKLIRKGHKMKSESDTEVILHLYEEFGENLLEKLNGMFAFVLWDKNKNRIFAARDRLGVKPFYYFCDKEKFIFSSEIKAILSYGIKAEPNFVAINDYLAFQFCLDEKTFFKGINKLQPGHYLVIENSQLRIKKYWDIDYIIDNEHSENYFTEKLTNLIENSVKLRTRSDVPIGAYLSGGIDTTIVTCFASKFINSKHNSIKTFTGFFPFGKRYDETRYAKIVSDFANTQYFQVSPTAEDFVTILPKLIYLMDEPAAGPGIFPQYFVSKLSSENVKVVLGGQGGDEIWGGYARYLIAYTEHCFKKVLFNSREEDKYLRILKSAISHAEILREYAPTLKYFYAKDVFSPMDYRYFKLISRISNLEKVFNKDFIQEINKKSSIIKRFRNIFNNSNSTSYFNRMSYFDIKTVLPALLQVEDRTSMAVSLESRVPLLDHRIVELSSRVSPAIKYKGLESKYLLKKATTNIIPKEILDRKDKIGFAVPLDKLYKNKVVKNFLREILLGKKAKERAIYNIAGIEKLLESEKEFGRQIWGLLCLELWFQIFIDYNYDGERSLS